MSSTNSLNDCSRERYTYLNSALFVVLMQGVYTVIFIRAILQNLVSVRHANVFSAHRRAIQHSNSRRAMALAATLMYTLATAAFVVRWYSVLEAYGPHGSDPEYLCSPGVSSWRMLFSEAMLGLNVVIADIIMTWRCWIVCGRSWKVAAFPAFNTVAEFALLVTTIGVCDSVGAPVLSAYETVMAPSTIFSWAYFCLSLLTTLYCTIGIIARIVNMSRANNISLTSYRGVLEIVVESALMYAVVLLIHVTLYFLSGEWGAYYSNAILMSVTGIAPTLILARVASGNSRSNDEWTARTFAASEFRAAIVERSEGDEESHALRSTTTKYSYPYTPTGRDSP